MTRKAFLKLFVNGGGLLTLGILAVPGLGVLGSPVWTRRRGEEWVRVGELDAFATGEVKLAVVEVPRDDWDESLRQKGVYVWREGEDSVVVYSRNCTDLSCPVVWDPGSEWFFCPCHGGIFSKDGKEQAGPPRRPLYRYASRIRDGAVEIDLRSLPPMT